MEKGQVKVLVIDDDPGWQHRLRRLLVRSGYQVTVARSIQEAEQALAAESPFDLVTVDMNLTEGGGEGWDLVEMFTESPRKPGIVIVSGVDFSPTEIRDLLRNYGHAVDFVPKSPFNREGFKQIVDALLDELTVTQSYPASGDKRHNATQSSDPGHEGQAPQTIVVGDVPQTKQALIGQELGQYRLVEQIGQGGMATVFRAYQPSLDRYVALKVLSPALAGRDSNFMKRFAREAKAIARLNHSNILPVYDFGLSGDYAYIAMRHVPGGKTLQTVMDRTYDERQAVDIGGQIAAALAYAHEHGVIHRDLKPSNVLLDDGWILLADFGLAKVSDASIKLSQTGEFMGTPAYMSPEQLLGHEVDYRTDIYALGLILYQMLTGTIPHYEETPWAIALKRIARLPTSPAQLNTAISEDLERVILSALEISPEDRFVSAAELRTELQTALKNDSSQS